MLTKALEDHLNELRAMGMLKLEQRQVARLSSGMVITEMIWTQKDYDLVDEYQARLTKTDPPPIIVRGWDIVDGYHRLAAHIQARRMFIQVIDLLKQPNFYDEWDDNPESFRDMN